MPKEVNLYNEIYWELLRRTPEYCQFYKKYAETNSLTEDHKKFIEDQGEFSSAPGFYGVLWPWMITSLMATKEFGVRFWEKGHPYRNERSLFNHGVLRPPVAPIVSPNIPFNQAPCEISFFPPDVELIECSDLGIPGKSESLIEEIERTCTWKEEAIFRVRLSGPVDKLKKEFEREIKKVKNSIREKGTWKLNFAKKPLFGKFFSKSHMRRFGLNTFRHYIRWYDLHVGGDYIAPKGLPFRTIALHEYLDREHPELAEETKKRIREKVTEVKTKHGKRILTGVIGLPIKGEDAVEKAVKYIYRAIHRKPYPSRISKQDLFNCPIHKEECPQKCEYMKKWYHAFNRRHMKFLSSHISIHESIEDPKGMKKPAKGTRAKIMGKIKHDENKEKMPKSKF